MVETEIFLFLTKVRYSKMPIRPSAVGICLSSGLFLGGHLFLVTVAGMFPVMALVGEAFVYRRAYVLLTYKV